MNYIFVGNIVNTHGLKGELRIVSNFKYKEDVFKKGNKLYVGFDKEGLVIKTYRKHKMYDMVIFEGLNDINEVIGYKGDKVFINKDEIKVDGILNEDLIGLNVYDKDNLIGNISEVLDSGVQEILVVNRNDKKIMIPYVDEFILNINLDKKRIEINSIKGLIDED